MGERCTFGKEEHIAFCDRHLVSTSLWLDKPAAVKGSDGNTAFAVPTVD
jgi:hypothetical protein